MVTDHSPPASYGPIDAVFAMQSSSVRRASFWIPGLRDVGFDIDPAVGDFNGDGRLDLAVANRGTNPIYTDSSVSVQLGNGDGTFQAAQASPFPSTDPVFKREPDFELFRFALGRSSEFLVAPSPVPRH